MSANNLKLYCKIMACNESNCCGGTAEQAFFISLLHPKQRHKFTYEKNLLSFFNKVKQPENKGGFRYFSLGGFESCSKLDHFTHY